MDSPFFRNPGWYKQADPISPSHSFRGVPVYPFGPTREIHGTAQPVQRPPERSSGPKVVRIPVQFVGSKQVDRAGSAVKIQKVFRGFLVRKCLKKIKDIKAQVDEIEEKLQKREVVDLVRKNERERLRMNESLMSLLFKLDSICGLDFGIRGCRKAVIRKAIALQERIDAIVAADSEPIDETADQVAVETDNPTDSSDNSEGYDCSVANQEGFEDVSCVGGGKNMEAEGNDVDAEIIDVGVDCEVKVSESTTEKDGNGCEVDAYEEGGKGDDNRRNRELLERMMEDNEKMMRLMSELCERNEKQTLMVNALTHRVELLEKAFVCDRMRRKKKSKGTAPPPCKDN